MEENKSSIKQITYLKARKHLATFKVLCLLLLLPHLLLSQDYQYDANGNLIHDQNKDIASIHYNYLNLADTITFNDGRKIIYTYTSSGLKIRQQALKADGSLKQKRDYSGTVLYKDDTLEQVQQVEGRIVPLLPGVSSSNNVYQYHLKDHLGNVRLTCTSRHDTLEYMASMEKERFDMENQWFKNLDNIVSYSAANHTPRGSKAIFLPSGSKKNPELSLAVRKGDIIVLSTYAYYEKGKRDNTKKISDVLIPAIIGSLTGGVAGGEVISGGTKSSLLSPALIASPTVEDELPQAYLNYQLFDKDYKSIDGGFQRVTQAGNFSLEKLSLKPIHIKQSGYLYVYLSNSSPNGQVVYFDDFNITYMPAPIIQEDSYYPFGMPLEEMHDLRAGEVANRHLFNGKELQDDHGLNWYDYGARMYDAALGRFFTPDKYSEKYASYTPYQMTLNNPVKFVDINGDSIWIVNDQKQSLLYEQGNLYTVTNGTKTAYTGPDAQMNAQGQMVYSGFLGDIMNGLNELSGSAKANRISNKLSSSKKNYIVMGTSSPNLTITDGVFNGRKGDIILWNPSITTGPIDENGNNSFPSYVTLAHELFGHGTQPSSLINQVHQGLEGKEWWASTIENSIRDELGLPLRAYYGIKINSIGQTVPDGPALITKDGLMWKNSLTGNPYINNYIKKIMPLIIGL